jgi:G3E family GTPase
MKPDEPQAAPKPRYIVIGGFLGSGKTTAITPLGQLFQKRGHKIGVVTNDEGTELVDTAQLRAAGFNVEEVTGGAFGTQPDALVTAAKRLHALRCDIIFAECSGTSGNLHATLLKPIEQKFGGTISIAPLSVLVDPIRAARVLRLQPGGSFSEKLSYIYRKQIEEAEILVINKTDLIAPAQLEKLRKALAELAPYASICEVSTRTGAGFDEWLTRLTGKDHAPPAEGTFDTKVYNEAEALLGWLNCTVSVSSVRYFEADKLLNALATAIQSILKRDAIEVAHLKLLMSARNDSTDTTETAGINLVRNDLAPELSGEIREPVQRADLILNLRAEAKPDLLHAAVNNAVMEIMEHSPELFARMEHCEHFRPTRRAA